jgi:hypothetical protein
VPGGHATVRTAQSRPVFEFRFQSAEGLQFPVPGATSPAEFLLVPLDPKNDHRELTVGEIGMHSYDGVKNQLIVQLVTEKLGPGHYSVMPKVDLKPGEYCFYYQSPATAAAEGTGGKLFAFGVDAPASARAIRN